MKKQSIGTQPVLYPTPVLLVGSYDEAGRANVMTAAWGGICCSKPFCVAVSLRKATYSYANIVARQAFTVGVPSVDQLPEADFFGIASGRDGDKLAAAGMTALRSERVDAPIIDELPLVLECRLKHTLEIGLHTQFVGEVLDILIDPDCLNEHGRPDIEKLRPFLFAPRERGYFAVGERVGEPFETGKAIQF